MGKKEKKGVSACSSEDISWEKHILCFTFALCKYSKNKQSKIIFYKFILITQAKNISIEICVR